jgi:hypothetical protein
MLNMVDILTALGSPNYYSVDEKHMQMIPLFRFTKAL